MQSLFKKTPATEPLRNALKRCRVHFVWSAGFSALVNLLYLAPTIYMMQVYDRVIPTSGLVTLALVTAIALFALATLAALDWLRSRIMIRAGLQLEEDLAQQILARTMAAGEHRNSGQVMREFDALKSTISGPAALAVFDAPWTPLYLACCFLLHPAIGVLTLMGGGLLIILAILNERETRPTLKQSALLSSQAYASQDALSAQNETIRALGMVRASIARHLRHRSSAVKLNAQAQFGGGRYSSTIKFLRLSLQSASLGLAAFLAVRGEVSAGSIIAASVLLSRAVAPIETLVSAWPSIVQAQASWAALVSVFSSTADIDRSRTRLPAPTGNLRLDGVSVRLPGSEQVQLSSVTLKLDPGLTLGVVGPSGSGKTTLARVVAGALAPTAGSVRIDGADYSAWNPDHLARHIGYLPQNPGLFAGSVKDNISRFECEKGLDQEDLDALAIAAARAAGAHDMILRLSAGYDTMLGSFGEGVSAGQAQRIALARALYRDPALLVLDEPNSSLDQEGEIALMRAIAGAAERGAAVIIVAHRAGVLARVDRLLTMKDGMVQLEGPREKVLSEMRAASMPAKGLA